MATLTWSDALRLSELCQPRAGTISTDEYSFRFVVVSLSTFRVEADGFGLVRAGASAWLVRDGVAEQRLAEPVGQALLLATLLWPSRLEMATSPQPVNGQVASDPVAFAFPHGAGTAWVDRATGTIVRLQRPDGSQLAELTDLRVADPEELLWKGPVDPQHIRDGVAYVSCDDGETVDAHWEWSPGPGMPGFLEPIKAATVDAAVALALRLSDRVLVRTVDGQFEAGPVRASEDDLPRWRSHDR